MTTITGAASPLSDARCQATAAHHLAADLLRDLLIHDMRTPLAAISGYAQILSRRTVAGNPDLAGVSAGLRCMQEAATRVGHLLDELAHSSPANGAGATNHHDKTIDLVQLVNRMAEESHAAALGRSRVVVLPAVPELVGWWNSARLERLFANLCSFFGVLALGLCSRERGGRRCGHPGRRAASGFRARLSGE